MAAWSVWLFVMGAMLTMQGLKAQDCGEAPLNNKIVGGENATAGSWPWQVSIHFVVSSSFHAHICGGTLIDKDWVLTAAHCIITASESSYLLYFGKQTQSGTNPNEVSKSVTQIIVHPDYNNTLLNNDIALMKLSSSVNFTDYIRPVCLAANSSQFHNSTLCWGTGWGRLGKDEPNVATDILQEVEIPVIGNKQCTCTYSQVPEANITANMLCAGELGKGICQGDSGGPLQCKQGSKWIQAGIASFGIPCAVGFPEVFARVSQFETWISSHVTGASVGFVAFSSSGNDSDSNVVCQSNNDTTTSPNSAVSSELSVAVMVAMFFLQRFLAL